jgi:hypothetical protein
MKHGLELIYDDLIKTKEMDDENFTTGRLHKTIEKVCYYCAEGILAKRAGVNKDDITDHGCINAIGGLNIMMFKRYGIDFNMKYTNRKKICPLCRVRAENDNKNNNKNDKDEDVNIISERIITDLEDIITHVNDWHSENYNDVINGIKMFAERYDVMGNGEPKT